MEGTVLKTESGYVARFERHLRHPVEKVWAALTEPARLADWLAQAEIEFVPGGKLQFRFDNTGSVMNGQVTQVQPPHLFEFVWNSEDAQGTLVRWELHAEPEGCLMVLTHSFATPEQLPVMLAGWHVHLDILRHSLTGEHMAWPWHRWEELRDQYIKQLGR